MANDIIFFNFTVFGGFEIRLFWWDEIFGTTFLTVFCRVLPTRWTVEKGCHRHLDFAKKSHFVGGISVQNLYVIWPLFCIFVHLTSFKTTKILIFTIECTMDHQFKHNILVIEENL